MPFWDYVHFGRRQPEDDEADRQYRHLTDGLMQIASQTCNILVTVNNTNNISYGNNAQNVQYNNFSPTSVGFAGGGGGGRGGGSRGGGGGGASTSRGGGGGAGRRTTAEDDGELRDVLIPGSAVGAAVASSSALGRFGGSTKNLFSHYRHRLSTVLENNTPAGDDDFELWDQNQMLRSEQQNLYNSRWGPGGWCRPSCIPITLIFTLIVLVVLLPLLENSNDGGGRGGSGRGSTSPYSCSDRCHIQLVESIPEGLPYPPGSPQFLSTYEAWMSLIASANRSIDIGTYYWALRATDVYNHSSAWQGERVFQALLRAGTSGHIRLRIAQSQPTLDQPCLDSEVLQRKKAALVRSVNFPRLMKDGGLMHTKLWVVDGQHAYVGSANNDWRALTQVKEMGVLIRNCSCLVRDVAKIFQVYWMMGNEDAKIPPAWPAEVSTKINGTNPMRVHFNQGDEEEEEEEEEVKKVEVKPAEMAKASNATNQTAATEAPTSTTTTAAAAKKPAESGYTMMGYFSSSPPQFSTAGRAQDVDAIVRVIHEADHFVYVAVMDYFPLTIYTSKMHYWPQIDDALRAVAIERKIQVRLLISWWEHSRPAEDFFLRSLQALSQSYPGVDVQVKRFVVQSTDDQKKIPYARVNHNKYMVTDKTAYIGTSNWSGDYFTTTAGIGLVLHDDAAPDHGTMAANQTQTQAAANLLGPNPLQAAVVRNLRTDLLSVFERDWNSMYALDLAKA